MATLQFFKLVGSSRFVEIRIVHGDLTYGNVDLRQQYQKSIPLQDYEISDELVSALVDQLNLIYGQRKVKKEDNNE